MILFIVGSPGAGKTTLVRGLLGMQGAELPIGGYLVEKPKWTVTDEVCAAGHYNGGTFDGADTVPYNGVVAALAFWREQLAGKPVTIFDGDRFSHRGVLDALGDAEVRCLHLRAKPEALAARRRERGSNQNASWVAGRVTKAIRFFELVPRHLDLDASASPAAVLDAARGFLAAP